ncbi:hypothetical protein [Pseudoxanthomonas sp.]|uniref:hypothetical protein n=1 Tax=Pseudoxanthomonas sp. TaxID=1871049 RepID=UPI00260E9A43|nr:hypothetical protein [Pseudoxanthomonas sp.]WDS34999.1 MAG: hypothetical protein O8I58_11495 [Pseudoxanthomonas sp.]
MTCTWLLGVTLLSAYVPMTQAPAATSFAPTINAVSGPADSLVCALLADAGTQLLVATAGHGQLGRIRRHAGINSCGTEGDTRRSARRAAGVVDAIVALADDSHGR